MKFGLRLGRGDAVRRSAARGACIALVGLAPLQVAHAQWPPEAFWAYVSLLQQHCSATQPARVADYSGAVVKLRAKSREDLGRLEQSPAFTQSLAWVRTNMMDTADAATLQHNCQELLAMPDANVAVP